MTSRVQGIRMRTELKRFYCTRRRRQLYTKGRSVETRSENGRREMKRKSRNTDFIPRRALRESTAHESARCVRYEAVRPCSFDEGSLDALRRS